MAEKVEQVALESAPQGGGRGPRDIDQSLIVSQLRRTVAERLVIHDRALALALALRRAGRMRRD